MKKKMRRNIFLAVVIAGAFGLGALLVYLPGQKSQEQTVRAYFFKGEQLVAVERPLNPAGAPLEQAFTVLLAGPDAREQMAGIKTQLPAGVKLRAIKMKNEVAIIDLSGQLENYGGGAARVEGIIAQIVYTGTEVPGVKKVWLWVDGKKEVVLGGEGLVIDRPLSRSDVKF